jgi:hypothetical protein
MKRILMIVLFLASAGLAYSQSTLPFKQVAGYCLNPSAQWIPIAAAVSGTGLAPGVPLQVSVYGQNGTTWYGLLCDASGNITSGSFATGSALPATCSTSPVSVFAQVVSNVTTIYYGSGSPCVWTAMGGASSASIAQYANRIQVSPSTILFAIDGDSRCSPSSFVARGDGTTAQATWNLIQSDPVNALYQRGTFNNQCIGGTTPEQMLARFNTNWSALFPNTTGNTGYFFTNAGVNDFVVNADTGITAFTNLRAYWNAIQAAGFELVAMTVYDYNYVYQDQMDVLDANIRASKLYINRGYTALATTSYTTTGVGTGGTLTVNTVSGTGAITSISMTGATGFVVNDILYPTQTGVANALIQVTAVSSGNPTAFTITTPPFMMIDEEAEFRGLMFSKQYSNDGLHLNAAGSAAEARYISNAFWGMQNDRPNYYNVFQESPSEATLPNYRWACPGATTTSLSAITTGIEDTVCGPNGTAASITTGSDNTFYGSDLGINMTTANFDTFVGRNIENGTTTGGNNHTAIGSSLIAAAGGDTNADIIAIGVSNTTLATGGASIAIGDNTYKGAVTTAASNNIAIGHGTAGSLTGTDNTLIGTSLGTSLTSDSNNTCVGFSACGGIQGSAGGNTAVGQSACLWTSGGTTTTTTSGCFGYHAEISSNNLTNAYQIGTGTQTLSNSLQFLTHEIADSNGNLFNQGAVIGLSIPAGTPTYTAGTNVTSCAQSSGYTNTNTRGELTIVGGTATTGTICTVNFSATLAAAPGMCLVTQNGGAVLFSIGHGTPSTTSFTITAGISVASATATVDYHCLP